MTALRMSNVHTALEAWQKQDMLSYCWQVSFPLLICASFVNAPIYSFNIFILDIQRIFSDGSTISGHAVYSASTCLAVMCLTGSFIGGRPVSHPRQLCFIGSVLSSLGLVLTGLAIEKQILWLLYLGLGVIGGLGMGCSYYTMTMITILSFRSIGKAGLGSGLNGLMIGLWSAAYSYGGSALNNLVGTPCTLYITAAAMFLLLLPPSLLFRAPPSPNPQKSDLELQEAESTDGSKQDSTTLQRPSVNAVANAPSVIQRRALVRHVSFWLLCVGQFCFILPGFGVKLLIGPQLHAVYNASGALQDTASAVFLFAYGAARLATGLCSDKFSVTIMYQAIGASYFAALLLSGFCIYFYWPVVLLVVLTSLQGVGMACCKVLLPVMVVHRWGSANASVVFGMLSAGCAPAVVLGPATSWLTLSSGTSAELNAHVAIWFWSCSVLVLIGVSSMSFVLRAKASAHPQVETKCSKSAEDLQQSVN